jgi:pimeloyl-ACP methyl ester carboxylesterase
MPTVKRGSFSTHFEETGQGEPVVLICGRTAEVQAWRFTAPELSKHFRVACFDNRGAGRSGAPDEPYSIEQMAEDLTAVLDHLRVPATSLLGWSMGGMIAQTFALAHPDKVRIVALVNTALAPDAYVLGPFAALEQMSQRGIPYEHAVRLLARLVYSPPTINNPKVNRASSAVRHRQSIASSLSRASCVNSRRFERTGHRTSPAFGYA